MAVVTADAGSIHVKELPEESKQALIDCFKTFDTDGDGYISIDELPKALNFAGIRPKDDNLPADILRLFDKRGHGKLKINELVNNYHILVQHSVNGEEMIEAFKKYDTNGDGYINLPELKKVLTQSGEKWSQEEAGQLLEDLMKFDLNGDGKFDYIEFVTMFMANSYPFIKPDLPKVKVTENFKMSFSSRKDHKSNRDS